MKNRFDQAYLQKESQQNSNIPIAIAGKLNELMNNLFTDIKSLTTYCGLTLEALKEYEKINNLPQSDEHEINKIGIAFDYLMIHYEIMELYAQGIKLQTITEEMIKLPIMLKDQPRKISPSHAFLMKLKLKLLYEHYEEWSKDVKENSNEKHGYRQHSAYKNISEIPERRNLMQLGFF